MANDRNNKVITRANRNVQNIAAGIQKNMDDLYRSTYYSTPAPNKDLDDLGKRINDNINRIVNDNFNTTGMQSISKLYTRIANKNSSTAATGTTQLSDDIAAIFNDSAVMDDLYGTFMNNRWLKDLDDEIDTVCKYMPELDEALETKKDNVLSADHFSKDFLNIKSPSTVDDDNFQAKIKELKDTYDLIKNVEDIYDATAKYGEKFVYIVPYETAIKKLLDNKPNTKIDRFKAPNLFRESWTSQSTVSNYLFSLTENGFDVYNESNEIVDNGLGEIIRESVAEKSVPGRSSKVYIPANEFSKVLEKDERFNVHVELDRSGIIQSAVRESKVATEKLKSINEASMATQFMQTLNENSDKIVSAVMEDNSLRFDQDGTFKNVANDGLVGAHSTPNPNNNKVKVPGCIMKLLDRERVIPVYIEDICVGYYYIEIQSMDYSETFLGFKNLLGDPLTNMKSGGTRTYNNVEMGRQDDTIRYIAGQLSKFIDKNFVNNNQDLRKEIYMILKYNDTFNSPMMDKIKVTFIPPEDIVHSVFKQDPYNHRGISDLEKALIPAKIYSSMYVTGAIAYMTRGQDKRMYYVKQTVDTNIAKNLLTVINQIKQSNFGIRQYQSINNVLNITGRFNDYVIPTNASGDPPISFEVMQGQNVDVQNDLMNSLKEVAVNTVVPFDIIQTRMSVDYATQLSMSSSKFLRTVYKRQALYQKILSRILTKLYDYEYGENIELDVELPPPAFLNVTGTNQLITNTKSFVDSIIEEEMAIEQDEVYKAIYKNEMVKYYLGSHIDISAHDQIRKRAKIMSEEIKAKTAENTGDAGTGGNAGGGQEDYEDYNY